MKASLFSVAAGIALAFSAPAMAWTNSANAGDYKVTASMGPDSRMLSLAVASESGKPAAVHAWFIDSEGMILGAAALNGQPGAQTVAYNPSVKVPANAAAVVVMTQPNVQRAALDGDPEARITQISLPR